jgi:hypothetical protein
MKKGLLFIGIIVTSIVMLFTTHEVKSFPNHSLPFKNETGYSISVYQIAGHGLPFNHSQDENAPFYKERPSFTALSSSHFIRLFQQGLFSYPSLFETTVIKKWSIREPSGINHVIRILCRDVISPNAP